jgi:hypothetical protein
MNKKKIIIITAIVLGLLLIVATALGLSKYMENKKIEAEKQKIITIASDFTGAWYNYTKQTSPIYLTSIKPYMTNSFYEATAYINTARPQDFEGQLPMVSSILRTEIVTYNAENAEATVRLSSKEGSLKAKEYSVNILLEKTGKSWFVSQMGIFVE